MGIQGLSSLIKERAPHVVKENPLSFYFGRKIAVDASMNLYQFLIAIQKESRPLVDSSGIITSHLQGFFYRTARMLENGLKPIFVFDGTAPELKLGELEKRREKREEAIKIHEKAKEEGDLEKMEKYAKRTFKISSQEVEETKRLLQLMGLPIVMAPSEAEAQCAAMVKAGIVYATGSEDMDTLTFGSNILLRNLTASELQKVPIKEYCLADILDGLRLSMDQFIDVCILLGCDYTDSIRGIGKKRAYELIKKYGNIEGILKHLNKKYQVPEQFPYEQVRKLFKEPKTSDLSSVKFEWKEPDEEGLVDFLVKEKSFDEGRVRAGVARIRKARHAANQTRLTSFFSPQRPGPEQEEEAKKKRKVEESHTKAETSPTQPQQTP